MAHAFEKTAQEWRGLQEETPIQLHAASLSMNVLFSLFPLLLVIVSLFGLLHASPERAERILASVGPVLPPEILDLVGSVFTGFLQDSSVGVFSIGFLLLIWSASRTMRSLTQSLDRVYRNKHKRPWFLRITIAVFATLLLGLLFLLASNVLVWGDLLAGWLLSHGFAAPGTTFLLSNIQWPLLFLIALGTMLLSYKLIPNHDIKTTWLHHLPGATLATLAWILGSLLFKLYLTFTSGLEIYGVIGIFIVLILYIQITSYAFLLGAYLNSVWEGLRHRSWLGRMWEGLTSAFG